MFSWSLEGCGEGEKILLICLPRRSVQWGKRTRAEKRSFATKRKRGSQVSSKKASNVSKLKCGE